MYQMDVKITFLNGELKEEIYMHQPKVFIVHGQENKVWKLNKSLWLNKVLKQWHEKFDNLITTIRFKVHESDKCINYKSKNCLCTIICLYLNDMLIFGSNLYIINNVKSMFTTIFDMKDLKQGNVMLGIKTRFEKEISFINLII